MTGFLVLAVLAFGQRGQGRNEKPNFLVIWGDDIGWANISKYNHGMMGYQTPNIDRIANEGALFTDWYAQQSCTAGRAAFILGQHPFRTGLLTIGMPGAKQGIQDNQATIAELLKPLGYTSGQFGKNHLGDRDEHLPTNHGFDEFFGNLYHLNAEEEPETYYYPKDPAFHEKYGPRGVLHSYADGRIEDTGPMTRKRMETADDEFTDAAIAFIERAHAQGKPFFPGPLFNQPGIRNLFEFIHLRRRGLRLNHLEAAAFFFKLSIGVAQPLARRPFQAASSASWTASSARSASRRTR